jgi:hypothetical protein
VSKSQLLSNKQVKRHVITSVVFTLVTCGIVLYLFSPSGLINQHFQIDLSFLLLPFLGYFILRLGSRLCGKLIPPRKGLVIATIINGTVFALVSYVFFSRVILLTRIPVLADTSGFLAGLSHISNNSILFFAGYTITSLAGLIKSKQLERQASPLITAIGQLMMGWGLWLSFETFRDNWSQATGIGTSVLSAMVAVAIANLGAYGVNSRYPVIADAADWLKSSPKGKFFIGGMIAVYFIFLRPTIFSHFAYAYLIEWLIICIISWRILAGIKGSLQKRYFQPLKEENWQKHIQKVDERVDEEFNKLVILQEDFIETGSRHDLLRYLQQVLVSNGLENGEIYYKLQSISDYSERKIPWYILGFWRRRIIKKYQQNRRKALNKTIVNLELVTQQSQRRDLGAGNG